MNRNTFTVTIKQSFFIWILNFEKLLIVLNIKEIKKEE